MKVRCEKIINEITGEVQSNSTWLSIGTEYLVLAIGISPGRRISLRLVGDDGITPALYDSAQFVTTCTRIPSNWHAVIGVDGRVDIEPSLWLRPGFWEDYFNGIAEAIRDYETERALIVAEVG